MTDAHKPHSEFVSPQAFQVIRECLAQGQRAMDELGWTQRDVMVMATLRRIEEQNESLLRVAHAAIAYCSDVNNGGEADTDDLEAAIAVLYPASRQDSA